MTDSLREFQLDIQIAECTPKPRKLRSRTFETRPVPSPVERLGALADPETAAKVAEADRINSQYDQAIEELKDLWGVW